MKTKEELEAMTHDELTMYALGVQGELFLNKAVTKERDRMREILAAVGIVYETYRTEFVKF